jgi:hypothetical protein
MNVDPSINHLLEFACPSIRYRVRNELLHQSTSLPEMTALQAQILEDEAVKEVESWQQPDGWLAWSFHGYGSMESGIWLLCEKGVESNHPVLARALLALECASDRLQRGIGKVGKILDDLGLGGSETIRAYLFAHAGQEEIPLVQNQVLQALFVFKSLTQIGSREDLYETYKDKFIFRAGILWPCIYHLRLLAFTRGWRTPENQSLILESIQHILKLCPIPRIHVRYKSQLIAPASFCMDNFRPDIHLFSDGQWMQWFHRIELIARLGVSTQIPDLNKQVRVLANLMQAGNGLFTRKLHHPYFQKWGAYTGLMLEKDWNRPKYRINDLTFRSLLILQLSHAAEATCTIMV